MIHAEPVEAHDIERAKTLFLRDGYVAVANAFTPGQLAKAREGVKRVVDEQTQATKQEDANRGFARYSFGNQSHHAEWAMLIDLPTILPIVDAIWGSENYSCSGAGGDYSLPGAKIQALHSDMGDFFADPLGQVNFRDIPAPFIVVNFLTTDFRVDNGAIRFIPGTQRSRAPIPSLDDEPNWMMENHLCAPAGTAIVRDVRCWHGGTPNLSDGPRVMTSVGYFAPWYANNSGPVLPRALYDTLSERGKRLSRFIVETDVHPFKAPKVG